MYLVIIPSMNSKTIREIASTFKVEVYSPTALSVEKPSVVGEIARYLCKAVVCFEVQPWD